MSIKSVTTKAVSHQAATIFEDLKKEFGDNFASDADAFVTRIAESLMASMPTSKPRSRKARAPKVTLNIDEFPRIKGYQGPFRGYLLGSVRGKYPTLEEAVDAACSNGHVAGIVYEKGVYRLRRGFGPRDASKKDRCTLKTDPAPGMFFNSDRIKFNGEWQKNVCWIRDIAIAELKSNGPFSKDNKMNITLDENESDEAVIEPTPVETESAPESEPTPVETESAPESEPTPVEPESEPESEATPVEPESEPESESTPVEPESAPESEATPVEPESEPESEYEEIEGDDYEYNGVIYMRINDSLYEYPEDDEVEDVPLYHIKADGSVVPASK